MFQAADSGKIHSAEMQISLREMNKQPLAVVQLTVSIILLLLMNNNICAISEPIYDTHAVEKDDRKYIPDFKQICVIEEEEIEQNAEKCQVSSPFYLIHHLITDT
ncbi:hypothetical protein Tco_0536686 [Tanacetum coccineum]